MRDKSSAVVAELLADSKWRMNGWPGRNTVRRWIEKKYVDDGGMKDGWYLFFPMNPDYGIYLIKAKED